jgi:hypothetical protein
MTEWNELLVDVLPMKGPVWVYAPGRELQKTLQPPTDWARWPAAVVTTANGGLTDANQAIVEWDNSSRAAVAAPYVSVSAR